MSITFEKLLASCWLDTEAQSKKSNSGLETLTGFSKDRGIVVSEETLQKAAAHLDGVMAKGDVGQWVVFICFFGHPHALWDFMLDAMAVASTNEHYDKIATELAEHILAHYGSMIPHFEKWALKDSKFKRMLTGVWRHRMSDDVWVRLRAIQSDVPDPLPTMIPLENGIEYNSDNLSTDDRANANKGRYSLDVNGDWQAHSNRGS